MPKAPVPAALADGKLKFDAVDAVVTHNPFAVNDVYFSRATGFPLDWMNVAGSSLIYGHPQGPTGARAVAGAHRDPAGQRRRHRAVHRLRRRGHRVALVLRVRD